MGKQLKRTAMLVFMGGCLLQFGGCNPLTLLLLGPLLGFDVLGGLGGGGTTP